MDTLILLIEDDTQIRENIKELLTLRGFRVETASNGRDGISQAMLLSPDLILCDIMMPDVNGYQVLDVIRANRVFATTPFVFLTAKSDPTDIRWGMNLGADDYLTKPFTFQSLLHTIESRLKREELRKSALKTQMDTYRSTLTSVAAHEYNTPLTGIIGFSSILVNDYQRYTADEAVSMMTMINLSGLRLKRSLDNSRLMNILTSLDPTQKAYAHFSTGSTVVTHELVERAMQAVQHRLDRSVTHTLDVPTATLGLSTENLRICLEELIDNAVKFSDQTQPIQISGGPDGALYRLTFVNKGQPFRSEFTAQIAPYQQFERGQYEQQGFGLGLAIVQKLLDLNQGRLAIDSPVEGETIVTIWVPMTGD
ncbi:two-component hybrid sensor and regulator [Fibrella aestuarina BUZ 2]|uniref:histidine kinase n=1 Tax=Fibrella aestuarina BUZ 2 TaxID=1166018 RepID=I0KF07_9BACT|nr:response regulator [Fibrella aestuarina]CCH02710.1 two-component hybrid sensor and regulator [Fibrella aestuarina BUZ 2]